MGIPIISRGLHPDRRIRFDSELPRAPKPKTPENPHGDSFKMARADAVPRYQSVVKSAGRPPTEDILAELDRLYGPEAGHTPSKPNRRA